MRGTGSNNVLDLYYPNNGASTQIAFINNTAGGASQTVGTIQTTGNATAYNTTSDRRLKENIAPTTLGINDLMQIPVDTFSFINDPTHATTTGFIAQDLYKVFPWAVSTNGDNGTVVLGSTSTPWSVDYGRVTPLIVAAVQDIANITGVFEQNLIAWLGNAGNGIADLFAKNIYATNVTAHSVTADELCAKKSDGTSVCVSGDQLAAVLAATNQTSSGQGTVASGQGSGSDASSSLSTDHSSLPTIQINGNNPATVQVGTTYNDLGATITGPQADLNFDIKTFLNGAFVSSIALDTTQAATDTIDYVVTDTAGNAATSTRTVIVQASQQESSQTNEASSTIAQ